MIPVITLAGFQIIGLLGGVVITGDGLQLPGDWRSAASAAEQLDVVTVLGLHLRWSDPDRVNLVVDVLYVLSTRACACPKENP